MAIKRVLRQMNWHDSEGETTMDPGAGCSRRASGCSTLLLMESRSRWHGHSRRRPFPGGAHAAPSLRKRAGGHHSLFLLFGVGLADAQIRDNLKGHVGHTEHGGMRFARALEALPENRRRRYATVPQPGCVEQTARGTGASHPYPGKGDLHLLGHLDDESVRCGGHA
jgi:hypothetical protein